MIKVFEHEHPLKLIDLQKKLKESDEEEDEDAEEEKDFITQEFLCTCKRCGEEINEYHRYYYKCVIDDESCVYHVHKFCAEIPTTLEHTSHPHPLTLCQLGFSRRCNYCEGRHKGAKVCYMCPRSCFFTIYLKCAVEADVRRIYHPSHPHPLVSLLSIPILSKCNACGIQHKGVFFQCTKCLDFALHTYCIKLPKSLLIQHTTNGIFRHTHPLTISYSFPMEEQRAKYYPKCRVCDVSSFFHPKLWIYKCEKCIYYAHVNCATSRNEHFLSILYSGKATPTVKNFVDADYPRLLHLPFPDQTYNIPKHLFSNNTRRTADEVSLHRINHQHDLVLVDTKYIDSLGGSTSSKISPLIICHDPMKRIQLLCDACLRPITEMPFYKCEANENESCNFALHEWCTRLPTKVDNHPGHPAHTLVLMPSIPHAFFNIFNCDVCGLHCNGYAYVCLECKYYVDVTCAFIPEKITHKVHPCHLLSIVKETPLRFRCIMCLSYISQDPLRYTYKPQQLGFGCNICDVYIHPRCAMLLPETIRHAFDKHPMRLSYHPIENHKSEYFCEICENELNPHYCFYHCDECVQSVHSACAPLILHCETETYSFDKAKLYRFLNVKFGGIHKTSGHPHPLSFSQGIATDGQCNICGMQLQYEMIFKCAECEFAIDYECCKGINDS